MKKLLLLILMWPILLSLSSCQPKPAPEPQRQESYVSTTLKENCYLCGDVPENPLRDYWGQDNIALLNLNTFEPFIFQINRYDAAGSLITEKTGSAKLYILHTEQHLSYFGTTNADRGFANGTIYLHSDSLLDLDKLKSLLCTDCLNLVMDAYLSDNGTKYNTAVVHLQTKEVQPLYSTLSGFDMEDYYVETIYKENTVKKEDAQTQIHIGVFYCPVRYEAFPENMK